MSKNDFTDIQKEQLDEIAVYMDTETALLRQEALIEGLAVVFSEDTVASVADYLEGDRPEGSRGKVFWGSRGGGPRSRR